MVVPRPSGPSLSELEEAHRCFLEHEPRDLFYRVAIDLLRLAREGATHITAAEALAGLLLTWNQLFYRFRPASEKVLVEDLDRFLVENETAIESVRDRSIESLSPLDREVTIDLFTALVSSLGPVGTAKTLHLIAPRFFPLWDDKIARAYGLSPRAGEASATRYWEFMNAVRVQCDALGADLVGLDNPLKAIDEFNYCRFTKGWL